MFSKLGKTKCFDTANTKCFGEIFFLFFLIKEILEFQGFF